MNVLNRAAGVCALLALVGGTASAQEGLPPPTEQAADAGVSRDPRAVEIIEASQKALEEADSLVFGVVKTMEKTDELAPENAIFASISIGAKGQVRAAKDGEGRWVYRIDGTADDIGRKDAFEIVILREPATVTWLEQESTTVVKANRNLARGRELSTETEFGVAYVFGEPFKLPLEGLTDAPTLEVLEPEVIDGELCDVVRAGFGKPNASGDKIVYIGTVDGLPRYVRDVLVTGFENRFRFTYETPEESPGVESLAIETPEGWGLAYRPENLRPNYRPEQPATITPATPGEGGVGYEVGNRAPAFTGQTMLGEDVNSDAIAGKPAVLVFWASWLPGSNELVDFLASTRETQGDAVELITFAVRERNPDAAFNMLAQAGIDDVPMLINARDAVLAYGITRAPIITIIDDEGMIRYRSSSSDVSEVVGEATELLGSMSGGE